MTDGSLVIFLLLVGLVLLLAAAGLGGDGDSLWLLLLAFDTRITDGSFGCLRRLPRSGGGGGGGGVSSVNILSISL